MAAQRKGPGEWQKRTILATNDVAVPVDFNPDKNTKTISSEVALKRLLALFRSEHDSHKAKITGNKDQFMVSAEFKPVVETVHENETSSALEGNPKTQGLQHK